VQARSESISPENGAAGPITKPALPQLVVPGEFVKASCTNAPPADMVVEVVVDVEVLVVELVVEVELVDEVEHVHEVLVVVEVRVLLVVELVVVEVVVVVVVAQGFGVQT
jgi:hypothetical protein